MAIALKLDQIVEFGRLDRSTVRYVLQSPEALPGMPPAGSPGRHRVFTVEQAVRLCVCAHLQVGGIRLDQAGKAIAYLERELRRRKLRLGQPPCWPSDGRWHVRMWDHVHLKLDCGTHVTIPEGKAWYDIPSGRLLRAVRHPVVSHQLDLSLLRSNFEMAKLKVLKEIAAVEIKSLKGVAEDESD